MKNIENFDNALNSKKNLESTKQFVNELNLIKNVPRRERIIDIKPTITKTKIFFGLFNCNDWSDHITYDLNFDGKTINIIKCTSYDDSYGGDYYEQTIVNIKLKELLNIKLI